MLYTCYKSNPLKLKSAKCYRAVCRSPVIGSYVAALRDNSEAASAWLAVIRPPARSQ